MTTRQGRRRRHRRHKAKAKRHFIRLCSAEWIGREHDRMAKFKAMDVRVRSTVTAYFIDGPWAGRRQQIEALSRYLEVAEMPPLPSFRDLMSGAATMEMTVRTTTYTRHRRQCAWKFFLGRVRVCVELPPYMSIRPLLPSGFVFYIPEEQGDLDSCRPQL